MTVPRFVKGQRAGAVTALLCLIATMALQQPRAAAHPETPGAVESYLHGLLDDGAITESQHEVIEQFLVRGDSEQLDQWLTNQERAERISSDTHLYLNAILGLGEAETAFAAAPASYSGNGNVTLLGQLNSQPPNPYYGDNGSTGTLYNGIWGYSVGSREYALQANSFGLHIIDVTVPAAPFQVQFIDMSGGVLPPKGRIWRDVDIHEDPVSHKTYAYVGAQAGGNFWIVDLSYLSGTTPHGGDANPIPAAGIVDRGRTNYGHTVFINNGLLFLNSANNGTTLGCQILDLLQNPFDPPIIASWSGSGHDCHDSFARTNVPWAGGKDLLYVADGYATRNRVIDITNVRTSGTTSLLGEAAPVSGTYSHSNWPTEDSRYLFAFEEFNVRDIGVYDVSNPASPVQVTSFQYSGDASQNSRIHNGQVRGNYLLTAYYEAGFRVFDVSNPANPVEVGKYETWRDPDGDGTFDKPVTGEFNGAWNLHVFLPSRNVLVSDMRSGTFIFRVDPIASPATVTGLSAASGDTQVNLGWTAATGATGYTVRRSTTSGGPYTTLTTNLVGTSFTDTGLTNGTTYYYVVTGTNAEGTGPNSSQASATPSGTTAPLTVTFTSGATEDGYVLEASESSNTGGSTSSSTATNSALRAGDATSDRQYKSIVSFDTSAIPDGATIISATLRLKRGTVSGTSPFSTHGVCRVDVQTGDISGANALQASDFQAAMTVVQAATLSNATANGAWSEGGLNIEGLNAINKIGRTQLRIAFTTDDDDDGKNDFIGYYSGDDSKAANRPQLVVVYR